MTNKLTNAARGAIACATLEHRFNSVVFKLQQDFAALAVDVYDLAFNAKTRAQIDALEDGWLPLDDDIQVQFGASMMRLQFNGVFTHRYGKNETDFHCFFSHPNSVMRRFPNNKKGQCLAIFEAFDPVTIRYEELTARKETLILNFLKAQKEIGVALSKFTTIDKLVKGWPEIEPFTVGLQIAKKEPVQLPAIPVQQLNEMLGLPV